MKILVLDNYDSFTYNLVHIVRELGYGNQMRVVRNDKISLEEIEEYDKILLSPGPGLPKDAGIMPQLIAKYGKNKHILGICLGHQGISENYGASLFNMPEVLHGVGTSTTVIAGGDPIFEGVPESFQVARYHSWSVDRESLNGQLQLLAVDDENRVMAVKHKQYSVYGLQFHPESVITEHGIQMMKNWLEM
ncbi:MAG: aminodeoxychorismate/anthranilate synthase component II [Bacteroidota bacterium]